MFLFSGFNSQNKTLLSPISLSLLYIGIEIIMRNILCTVAIIVIGTVVIPAAALREDDNILIDIMRVVTELHLLALLVIIKSGKTTHVSLI